MSALLGPAHRRWRSHVGCRHEAALPVCSGSTELLCPGRLSPHIHPVLPAATRGCEELAELRLNHNRLAALPGDLARNQKLRIVELGGNPIASFDDIQVRGGRAARSPLLHG